MYCPSCGKELPDNAKFCAFCGTVTSQQPVATEQLAPVPPRKEINLLKIILPAAALLVVAVLVGVLIFNSPKLTLSRAAAKSITAYTQAVSDLEITDFSKFTEEKAYNTYTDLTLTQIETDLLGQLPIGIGLRLDTAVSIDARDITMSLTPYYGAVDLLTAQAAIQDSLVLAYAPDLLGDTYYAADTTTLGKDLVASGLTTADIENLGFNLFDLVELMESYAKPSQEATEALTDAAKDLLNALEIKKGAKAALDINGSTVNCKGYTVTVPQTAMETFLQALEEYANATDYEQMYREIYLALGMPADTIDDFFYGADFAVYEDLFRELEEVIALLGDLELQVYVSGGYISAIFWEDTIDDIPISYALRLGGSDTYVNDLSLEVTVEDSTVLVTSHGNHCGAEDTYSDELIVGITEYGETYTLLESEFYYYPEKAGTLEWTLDLQNSTVAIVGSLNMEKDSFFLSLEEVSLELFGNQALAFSLDYSLCEYTPLLDMEEYTLLLPMTPEKKEQFTAQVQKNLFSWVTGLLSQIPEFMGMLY